MGTKTRLWRHCRHRLCPAGGQERGAALVEFAMVLPLLVVLLFSIADFGRAFQTWITVTNAAREGARLGATGATSANICSRVTATAGIAGTTCTVTNAEGATGSDVTVQVRYTLSLITPLGSMLSLLGGGGMSSSFNINSTAVMRLE